MSIVANRTKILFLPVIRGFYDHGMTHSVKSAMRAAAAELGASGIFPADDGPGEGLISSDADVARYFQSWRADMSDIKALIAFSADFMRERAVQDTVRLLGEDVPVFLIVNNDDPAAMVEGKFGDALCGSFSVHHNMRMLGRRLTGAARIDMGNDACLREVLGEYLRVADAIECLRNMRVGMIGVNPADFATTFTNQQALFRLGFSLHPYELLDMWGDTVLGRDLGEGARAFKGSFGEVRLRNPIRGGDPRLPDIRKKIADAAGSVPADEKLDLIARGFLWVQDTFERDRIDTGAIHCWPEFSRYFGVRPCAIAMLSNLLLRKPVVCEQDVPHAIMARLAIELSGEAGVILDINNNGWDPRVFNVFHCSQTPPNWLVAPGAIGEDGTVVGRMRPAAFTAVSAAASETGLAATVFSGQFLRDDPGLRGSSGWAFVPNLPDVLKAVEETGIHHFVAMHGSVGRELAAALRFRGLDVRDMTVRVGELSAIEAELPAMPKEIGKGCPVFSR